MNRFLLAIGGLMVGLLAILFAAPTMVDWNRYRGVFEEEASRFLGREVRVGGEVNLRLLPVPFVRFEKVRVADTTANVGKPLFMADDFTVWLSIGGLLGGRIEASAVELRKPVVTLVLDGKGGGSWSSLAEHRWPASFTPARVAFDAVRITSGRIDILSPAGEPRAVYEHINGELSATALEGPYKVTAAFATGGAPRELRLSTAKPGEDGTVRVKGTVRDPASGVSYSLDGLLRDILGKTRLTGELTARLPLPSVLDPIGGEAIARRRTASEFDVRSEVEADTTGMTLKELALSFEQAGRPQLATGAVRVNWADQTETSVTLKSHWLDLDRIAGGNETTVSPLRLVQTLAVAVGKVLDSEGRTTATLGIDQATLGGDVVSGLEVTLEQSQGKLLVRNVSAALPGGARLAAAGAFDLSGPEPRYDGRINLRGASVGRFLGWATKGNGVGIPTRDGPFSLIGDVTLSSTTVGGRNVSLQVGRNALTGEASWKAGKSQELLVNLEGSELDLSPFLDERLPPSAAFRQLIARLSGTEQPGAAATSGPATAEVRLRVDRLIAGTAAFRDAVAELRLAGGNLSLPQLKLSADEGYSIELKGDIADLARPGAKGSLTGHATADRAAGVVALGRLVGAPAELLPAPEAAAAAVPLRMAGRLQVGGRGPSTLELTVDGGLGTSRVAGTIRLGPETSSWRERSADFSMTLEGTELAGLLGSLVRGERTAAASGQTQINLRGIGTARNGLAVLGAVRVESATSEYRGRLAIDDTGGVGLDGELELSVGDLARGLALAGLPSHRALAGPVSGTLAVVRKGERLTLSTERVAIAGTNAAGRVVVEPGVADSRRISGDIKLGNASLPGVLASLTTGRQSEQPVPTGPSPWSEAALDLSGLDGVAGSKLRVEVESLALAPGVVLAEAKLDVSARPGGLELRLDEAKALGGRTSGLITLDKAPAGARLVTEARLTGAKLESLSAGPAPPAATGGLAVSFKGQSVALTPRGLVVALTGTGEASLDRASLRRWSPSAVGVAADAIISLKGEIPPDALRQQLELALSKGGGAPLGSQRLTLTLADGAVRAAPLIVNTPRGRLQGRLAVDLDLQRVDAEWRIEPRGTPQPAEGPVKPELPGITVIYAGPLATLGSIAPRIDMDALEREVAVRKVEREVAELERLRRQDEERARQEAARLEEERRITEQRRLEALGVAPSTASGLPTAPPAAGAGPAAEAVSPGLGPAAGAPGQPGAVGSVPVSPGLGVPATGSGSAPGGAGTEPGSGPTIAVPPSTVDVGPIPRPVQRPRPAQAPSKLDPFRSLGGS
ncbi:MAG: AsmA family protein [Hyphomicrobiaceae bacterium]|nr:AsmA family protein [Hyphomicrobiaceae bacterium]